MVSYRGRLSLGGEEHGLQSRPKTSVEWVVISRPGRSGGEGHGEGVATVEAEQVVVDGQEIGVEFLDLTDPFLGVVFGEEREEGGGQ